ncbi:MAG TPA: hypothetical protein VJ372_09635 [Pyrinomonadaceae bacterium]|nr:hypothetical protein [Pyrinomonadaceae bacterium]
MTALTILVVAAVYFLGSAISPLATQLLNDADMPAPFIKIQDIRTGAYLEYSDDLLKLGPGTVCGRLYCATAQLRCKCQPKVPPQHTVSPQECWKGAAAQLPCKNCQSQVDEEDCGKSVDSVFLVQEQAVFKRGSDQTERVSRLFERAIVLRGAVFNGFAFVVLCCFSYLARARDKPFSSSWSNLEMTVRTLLLIAISVPLICMGWIWGKQDLHHHDPSDPPIMEAGLIILGCIGLFTLTKGVVKRPHLGVLVVGFILTILAYGSWAWTEFLYAKNVIGAFFAP